MSYKVRCLRRQFASLLFLIAALSGAAAELPSPDDLPVLAELAPGDSPAPPAKVSRSQNVTINLINRLVQRGVLTKEDSAELIRQAEDDATQARAESAAAIAASAPPPITDDTVRVTYIPEIVKAQMRDQIRQEVMAQAREENWAAPRSIPDWTKRFRFFGDIRIRGEGNFFPDGNDNTGAFPNFNAINSGDPFDVSGTVFSPQLNVDQTRYRVRLRARLGADLDLGEGFSAGLRLATGENNSPVTTNQTLGGVNSFTQGQGGNFSKYAIWLDRAFLKYELGGLPTKDLWIAAGRFENPFFSTEMIWDDDLGFDGFALQGKYEVLKGVTPFVTAGAFPVFNTDFNFSSIRPAKFESHDKWLYGVQGGTDWRINKDLSLKVAAAYYYFKDIEGKLSDPFTPLNSKDAGNTDATRPAFAQKGNTYMALRNIVPNALNNFGTINQFQYFGLATPFREVALTGKLDYSHFEPFHVILNGEFVKNVAFDVNAVDAIAVNNRGATVGTGPGPLSGGDTAWIVGLKAGHGALEKRWDWNLGVNYRYVESDAVVDGFTDSDFGGGGTNLKGYTIWGALALSERVWLGVRWLSADGVAGPPFRAAVLQVDVNGKF